MKVAAVRDISEQVRGVTYAKSEASAVPRSGYSPMLRANNIGEHGLLLDDLIFVPNTKISRKQRIVSNDVVVAASSGSLSVVGKTTQVRTGFDGGFGAFCKVLRPGPDVDPYYFGHYFKTASYRRVVSQLASGVNINNLKKEHLDNIQIPLPPLAEQRRIAEILDAADALRAKRREALAQLDTLLQSTFLDMFGDPVTNPLRWRVGRLKDYFSKTRAGTCCGPFGSALKKHEYVEDGIPVWGIDNVKPNQFLQERSLFITPEKFAELQRYSVESGDILISRAGTVGRMCVAVPTVEQSIIGTNLIRLTLDPSAMSPVFFASLYTFCGERLPGLRASGDDRAYSFLNTTRLKSLVVPLPPLDMQCRFAAIVQSVEQQKTRQRAHLAELDTLFASLQSRAFRGDL